MGKELRILILEDNADDAELEICELRKAGLTFTPEIVDTNGAFQKALDEFSPDIILSDYDLPTFNGLEALKITKEKCPDVPFLLVTGRVGEEFAIETLKKGVTDYVMKGNLKRLVPCINRALEEAKLVAKHKQAEEEREKKNKEIQFLLKSAQAILEISDFTSTARRIFDMACEMTGAQSGYVALLSANGEENEVLFLESGGLPCSVDPYLPMPIRGLRGEAYKTGSTVYDNDFMNSHWVAFMPDGHVELKNVLFAPLNIEGKTVGIMGLANKPTDFTEDDCRIAEAFGQQAAIALRNSRNLDAAIQSEQQLRAILDATPFPIALVDLEDNNIEFWSRSALTLFGHTAPTASEWYRLAYPDPEYRREVIAQWKPMLEKARSSGSTVNTGKYRVTCSDGSVRICELYASFLKDKLVVTFNDITERKKIDQRIVNK